VSKRRIYGFLGVLAVLLGVISWQAKPLRHWLAKTCFTVKNCWPQGAPPSQRLLDAAIWLDPYLAKAYLEKSVPFNKRGDYAQGMYYLNQAVALQPREYLGYRGWVRLYMLHDYEGSTDDLRRYDAFTPHFTDYPWSENLYFLLGLNYLQLNKPRQAVRYFQQASATECHQFGAKYVNPYNYLYAAIAHLSLQEYPAAIQQLDSLSQLNAKCSEAAYYKAVALYQMQRFTAAARCLDLAAAQYQQGYRHWNAYFDYPYQLEQPAILALRQVIQQRVPLEELRH
jgi:tetratricopeptide (TPR) repeat protein